MAPGVVDSTKVDGGWSTTSRLTGPLKYSGSLEEYKYFDATPILGREFPTLQLSDILNDDRKVRDLAILGERRTSAVPIRVQFAQSLDSVPAERRFLSQPKPHGGRAENIGPEARRIDGQA